MNKKSTFAVILILVVIIAGIYIVSTRNTDENIPAGNSDITVKTKVYFADETGSNLVSEYAEFTVENDNLKYSAVIQKLIEGPDEENLYRTVNSDTKLNGVTVTDGLCTVDFSDSFIEYNTGGTLREMLCIYSIVNTLCEFEKIDKVIFTVDGKQIKTFGQLDMTEPFTKEGTIIKE